MGIKIKLLCNWMGSAELTNIWKKYKKIEDDRIELIQKKDDHPDIYVIINWTDDYFVYDKAVLFIMEPYFELRYPGVERKRFLKFIDYSKHMNLVEWHISLEHSHILYHHPVKSKKLSTVVSSKYTDPGHKFRVDLIKALEEKGETIDIYGRDNLHNFRQYIKAFPYHHKNEGLFPYRYTINVENHSIANYFTEKITDAILSECLVFYAGCPNIREYIDEGAYVLLDENDIPKSINIIQQTIKNNEWEKRIECIRREKRRILDKYNMFDQIYQVIVS